MKNTPSSRAFCLAAFSLLALAACSDDTGANTADAEEYRSMFGPPQSTTATPDNAIGLWARAAQTTGGVTIDSRLRFAASQVTSAVRCTNAAGRTSILGVRGAARIASDEIALLESKEARNEDCVVKMTPMTLSRCSGSDLEPRRKCFTLSGTTMTLYESPIAYAELTKVSD